MEENRPSTSYRVAVQRMGRFLSGMVMPSMGAVIAWGLGNAVFGPTGWFPNEELAAMNGLMIMYLIPLLIGYAGGRMIHGDRGGVVGAVAALGAAASGETPMIIGAMVVGPLAGWVLKRWDRFAEGKLRSGFEMIAGNFSAGIVGAVAAWAAYAGIGPLAQKLTTLLSAACSAIIETGMLPLASAVIEPAKLFFLNNAIQHGVLNPIAIEQTFHQGKSIVFLLESNPGPGIGILLAYWIAGNGKAKQSALGAAAVLAVGGLHEIYFPFVLKAPRLLAATVAGGMAGTYVFSRFDAGLTGTPSPGSIIAYLALAPGGDWLPILSGVLASTGVSLLAAVLLLKTTTVQAKMEETEEMAALEGERTGAESASLTIGEAKAVGKIVFACDAGMGSSALGASLLRRKMKAAQVTASVTNTAISDIPEDAEIVITHRALTERAKARKPDAEHISIDDFLKSPEYDRLIDRLKERPK